MGDGFRGLVEAFGRGWETADAEAIVAVFTPDAVFQDSPFGPRETGHAAIRAYWADVPKNQAEVTFKAGEIFTAGTWFAAEYRCTFRRRRTGEWVDVRGAMFCETKDGKISEMRMYFHRNT
jgi:ketosteroid isomerase-like protein